MSQENVELVKRAIAAINARDIDAYLACCTEDVEMSTPLAPIGGDYVGRQGIERFLTDVEDAAPDFQIEIQHMQAVGADQVIAFVHFNSSGRVSGISTAADGANVYDCTQGRVRRVRIFFDRAEALRAVGLTST